MTSAHSNGSDWVMRVHAKALKRGERKALSAWLAASPDHARDFLRAETIWRLTGGLAQDPETQLELADVKRRTESAAGKARWALKVPRLRMRPAYALLAAFAALGIGLAAWLLALAPSTTWYETTAGEQRTITLPDGSMLALNTKSRIGVTLVAKERTLNLTRGEAMFDVVRDPIRPFVVHAGRGTVRAIGTRFNVLLDEHQAVTVAVLEGRVEVATESRAPAASPTLLDAGQSTAYEKSGRVVVANAEHASRERISAWREGKLRFDSWRLADAVREHNRYARKPLTFGSPELEDMKVSGVFRIGDTQALLSALRQLGNVKAEEEGDAIVLSGE